MLKHEDRSDKLEELRDQHTDMSTRTIHILDHPTAEGFHRLHQGLMSLLIPVMQCRLRITTRFRAFRHHSRFLRHS